jgi:hypothetical protein
MQRSLASISPARALFASLALAAAALLGACSDMGMHAPGAGPMTLKLTGAQEVPPVETAAVGEGVIKIAPDGAVSGSVTTTGIAGIMAHIHIAAPGVNGPVIVPLAKMGDNTWSVPAGAKLTPEQMAAYQSGNLYVNVHSEAHKGGEIRAQLMAH